MTEGPRSHRVDVTREDGLWVAVVDGLPGGATDVEHYDDLDTEVRDLIAGLTDAEPGDLAIDWHYRQDDSEYTPAITTLREWEEKAAVAVATRDTSRRAAIDVMRRTSLSYRDIADVLGISYQRVAQIAQEPRPRPS